MRMKLIFGLVLSLGMMAGAAMPTPEHTMPAPKAGSQEFEMVKGLAGTWKGTAQSGSEAVKEAAVEYKVTSNGSVVVETLFPGTPHEMVSIYHDDKNGKLTMTHYCALGNQPQLDLQKSEGGLLELGMSPANAIPSTEDHMDSLKLAIKDGELKQTWQCLQSGKPGEPTVIDVKKV